jgi:hypothetical protein
MFNDIRGAYVKIKFVNMYSLVKVHKGFNLVMDINRERKY